ncbi:hypothetical protein TTHERM_00852720 (macronuclear) [Tetrahymena thermophila SB210]|uniref:Uncharacterized protein n=1 Tax=Tetrahymena thermophila (strain SB210) TaxID=312017 RepID=Q24E68_TETTS|nr:hypothetical protein TTHERM_00852720 [Tetrahymena thermophila SB210]EAS06033.4 hypothetical protein TTHERM_00852720 [Tetrahymena thermophila SB210]|eukprot:XP_001026278.4 hypothetical protein TTHERM_00852720 [Tetrahymena thermophila SB210]
MNQRLKLLAQKKETNISSAANLSTSNVQNSRNANIDSSIMSDEDDNHNDILSFLQNDKPIQAKSENIQQLNNQSKVKQSNLNQNQRLAQQVQTNQVPFDDNSRFAKMSKQEEISYAEQENYNKKKLKKPFSNVNPVLMKFQNKQNNQKMQINQQNSEIIEPKIEEEATNLENEDLNSDNIDKIFQREQSFENENKTTQQKDQNTVNKRQFSVSVNSVENKANQNDSNNSLVMRIQGKVNEQKPIMPSPNKPENQTIQDKVSLNQNVRGLNQILNTSEDDEDEDDDIEHLKQISKSTQNTQMTKPQQINQNKSNQNSKFSILPIMKDSLSEQTFQQKQANSKEQLNKLNQQNTMSQNRNDQDLSMFDALFEANEEISRIENESNKMDEDMDDKKSVADMSMFIQIQQESEDDGDEIALSKKVIPQMNNQKPNQIQQASSSKINNKLNVGLQNTLNKYKDQQNIQMQNQPEKEPTNTENKQNNLFSKQKQTSLNYIQNKLQSNTNQNQQQQLLQKFNVNNQQQSGQVKPQININRTTNIVENQKFNSNNNEEAGFMQQKAMKQPSLVEQIPKTSSSFLQIQNKLQNNKFAEDQSLSNSVLNMSYVDENKKINNIYKTPVQNSKTNNYQQKITQYSMNSQKEDEDDFYKNFESSYQNIMFAAKPNDNNRFNNNTRNMNNFEESMDLTKGNISRNQMNNTSYLNTTNKKQNKKNIPQVTPYKINLRLYQKKKKIKQSVEECKVWHYYLDKMYNLTSQQFELKLANSTIPKELKEYNIKQIFRGVFNNKKIPFLAVIMIEYEILHQIVKATLLDFSCSIIGSFSKNLFMDDIGENNQSLIIKKEEPEDEEEGDQEDESDDDFINRNNKMSIEGDQIPSQKQDKKKKEKKMDFSTVYTLNHERGTQISLKLNTLLVLKDVTVIQQNEEPPFLNISEKNVVQVVYPF